jgi:serine/threonine protein kinase
MAPFPHVPGYRLIAQLGRGGFSVVYRAEQEKLGREVALKVIAVDGFGEEERKSFERECRALAEIGWHPNVVQVFDAGLTADDQPFIAMELMTGGALQIKGAVAPMPIATVKKVGIEIADALDAAHRAGILHRDVKPDNILLDRLGNYRLADFGISGLVDGTRTGTGNFSGTVAYLAPEILRGQQATASADIYSLGATLHTLLTGNAPFGRLGDTNVASSLHRILHEEPPSLTPHGAPADLAAVIDRAMRKYPSERFESAAAFCSSLRATGSSWGETVVQPPIVDDRTVLRAKVPTDHWVPQTAPVRTSSTERDRNIAALIIGSAAALALVGASVYAGAARRSTSVSRPATTTTVARASSTAVATTTSTTAVKTTTTLAATTTSAAATTTTATTTAPTTTTVAPTTEAPTPTDPPVVATQAPAPTTRAQPRPTSAPTPAPTAAPTLPSRPAPSVRISGPARPIAGCSYRYSAEATNADSIAWSNGASGASATYKFAVGGSNVSVIVSQNGGASDSASMSINAVAGSC